MTAIADTLSEEPFGSVGCDPARRAAPSGPFVVLEPRWSDRLSAYSVVMPLAGPITRSRTEWMT
jgi:hypothetical protein